MPRKDPPPIDRWESLPAMDSGGLLWLLFLVAIAAFIAIVVPPVFH
jgi:hypothetical protein